MATYEEAFERFTTELNEMGFTHHPPLYHAIAKHLGPSIHDEDSSLVACDQPKEIETVKREFLIGKLGLEDGPALDAAIEQVCKALGGSNTQKHRVSFYYLLVAILQKEHLFINIK
ncbi:MAG TPA: DUF2853 family protein [Fluviicola sp.]|nr:DUF2853 family protein [Fluviicola sp.]